MLFNLPKPTPSVIFRDGFKYLTFIGMCVTFTVLLSTFTFAQADKKNEPPGEIPIGELLEAIDKDIAHAERSEEDVTDKGVTFRIDRVSLTVNASTKKQTGGGVAFTIPVIELGADGSTTSSNTESQILTFQFVPAENILVAKDIATFGLAQMILDAKKGLRDALEKNTSFIPTLVTIERKFLLISDEALGVSLIASANIKTEQQSQNSVKIEMTVLLKNIH